MSKAKEWKKETVKERRRRVDTYRMRGKKGVAVFARVFGLVSFSQRASSTIYLVKKQLREGNMRLSALPGMGAARKPQHRGIMGNHRRKLGEADPIIRETLAAGRLCLWPSHTHSSHTAHSKPGPSRELQQQLSEHVNVWRVSVDETVKCCSPSVSQQTRRSRMLPLPEKSCIKRACISKEIRYVNYKESNKQEQVRSCEMKWQKEHTGGRREGGITTFLLQGEKRQHSVGDEERVDSNWITGQKQNRTIKPNGRNEHGDIQHTHGQKRQQYCGRIGEEENVDCIFESGQVDEQKKTPFLNGLCRIY